MPKPPSFNKPKCNSPAYSKFQHSPSLRLSSSLSFFWRTNSVNRCNCGPTTCFVNRSARLSFLQPTSLRVFPPLAALEYNEIGFGYVWFVGGISGFRLTF
jgi:hypothetical protein